MVKVYKLADNVSAASIVLRNESVVLTKGDVYTAKNAEDAAVLDASPAVVEKVTETPQLPPVANTNNNTDKESKEL